MDVGAVASSPVVAFTGPTGVVDSGAVASSPCSFTLQVLAGVVDAGAVASSPVVDFTGPAGVVDARCCCLFSCSFFGSRSCRSGGC